MKRRKMSLTYILLCVWVVIFLAFMSRAGGVKANTLAVPLIDPSVPQKAKSIKQLTITPTQKMTPTPTVSPTPKATKSERVQIFEYIVQKFGHDADKAFVIIRQCENGTFDPRRESGLNHHKDGRVTIDIGVMMINVDANNKDEIERLKDYKYNIDKGYAKYKQGDGSKHKNSFYLWTCGHVVGDYTYVDRLKGVKK